MEVVFLTYFATGVSWNKLAGEMPTNDKGQKYRIRTRNDKLQVARYLFKEEHKDNCCNDAPGGSEYFDENQQAEVINIFTNHAPNTAPLYLQVTLPPNATLSALVMALAQQCDIISAEEFEDCIYIHFGTIPNLVTVNNIINSHVEPEKIENVLLSKKASQNILFTNDGQLLTSVQPNEVIVSKNSGQFASVVAAINYINTLQDKAVVIKLYPGTYIETEPIILPNYVCLVGQGSAGNTIIYGAHAGIVVQSNDFNFISNINIVGGTIGINHNGANVAAFTLVKDCLIKMNLNGMAVCANSGYGSLVLGHVSIYADTGTGTGEAICSEGGSLIMSETIIQAQAAYGIKLSAAKLTIDITSIYYCQTALALNNGSSIKGTLVNMVNCANGLHIMADTVNSAQCSVNINYLHVDDSTGSDIITDAATTLELYSGHIDVKKILKNVPVEISGIFSGIYHGSLHQTLIGENFIDGELTFGSEIDHHEFALNEHKYLATSDKIYYMKTSNLLTSIEYYNGAWTAVNFMRDENYYWLDKDYAPTTTIIDGKNLYWLRVTGETNGIFEFFTDTVNIEKKDVNFIGSNRKEQIIYLDSAYRYFIRPANVDASTAYEIIVKANTGITINGEFYGAVSASKKVYWTADEFQSFTLSATGITLLAVRYYIRCI